MNTGAVCELVKQIDGIDTTMLPQYTAIIKKVGLLIHIPMLLSDKHACSLASQQQFFLSFSCAG